MRHFVNRFNLHLLTALPLGALFLLLLITLPARTQDAPARLPGDPPAPADDGMIHKSAVKVEKTVSEALLGFKVRTALLEHLRTDALRVDVDVSADTVTLNGAVKRNSSQELAESVAKSVTGVRKVDNRLTVSPDPGAARAPVGAAVAKGEREVHDALLETRIKTRLLETIGKAAFSVEVEATDGVVSLSGTLPEKAQRELAVKTARQSKGVTEVHDLLKTP